MHLTKEDYQNIRVMLDEVPVRGVKAAQLLSVLAHKIELRVANWFDGHPSGYESDKQIALDLPPPAAEALPELTKE